MEQKTVQTAIPSEVDAELADYQIFGAGDAGIKFKTLYETQRAIVIYIRHFNCYVCKDFVKALGQQINFEEYKKLNIGLHVIGCGKQTGIKLFSKDTNFPINNLFVDPDRFSYNKLGMIRAKGFSELKGDGKQSQETSSSVIGGFSWSLWKQISRGNQGDVYQLGGAYVFDTTGKILHSFIDRSAEAHISIAEINELAQKYGKKQTE